MLPLVQYKTVRDRIMGQPPGEFFVYDVSTARDVTIGDVNGENWVQHALAFPTGDVGRYQPVFMARRNRAGFVAGNTNSPFRYSEDRGATVPWSSVNANFSTVNALMFNPVDDELIGICNTGIGHKVIRSLDGGDSWDQPSDYGGAGAITRSYGAWGANQAKYVFCDATANILVQNNVYYATDPLNWSLLAGGMGGEFGGGFAVIRYAPTLEKYMSVSAGGNGGNTKQYYSSTVGINFVGVTISADNVAWWDVIEVQGIIIAVAGQSMVPGSTSSNLCARSTDGGGSFNVAASMPASRRWSYMAYNGKVIACVAATEAKVAVTRDLGETWQEYDLPSTATQHHIGAFYQYPVWTAG